MSGRGQRPWERRHPWRPGRRGRGLENAQSRYGDIRGGAASTAGSGEMLALRAQVRHVASGASALWSASIANLSSWRLLACRVYRQDELRPLLSGGVHRSRYRNAYQGTGRIWAEQRQKIGRIADIWVKPGRLDLW
jgi:hypothetical protein